MQSVVTQWQMRHAYLTCFQRYSTKLSDRIYIITFFFTCFILPLGVIIYCYGKLLGKLRKVSDTATGNQQGKI